MDNIIKKILPITVEDNQCLQKKMIKERNREVLKKALIQLQADPYLHFKVSFETTHLSQK